MFGLSCNSRLNLRGTTTTVNGRTAWQRGVAAKHGDSFRREGGGSWRKGVVASAELFSRGVVLARVLCGSPPA